MTLKPGRYLFDTSALIKFLAQDQKLAQKIDPQSILYAPVIVIGELYYGALNSKRPDKNIELIDQISEDLFLLNTDLETARLYARIKLELKSFGKQIPENDLWIAALAVQHGLSLIAYDKHFEYIKRPGFSLVSP